MSIYPASWWNLFNRGRCERLLTMKRYLIEIWRIIIIFSVCYNILMGDDMIVRLLLTME